VARRVRRIAAKKACPAPFAADASAAQDAGRWDAIHGLHQEVVRDCRWEAGRDFLSVMAELERQVLPEHWDELESRRAQLPQDDWPKAVCRTELLGARAPRVAPLRALQQAHAGESELLQAQWLPVPRASRLVARLLLDEPAPSERPEQWPQALRARSALLLAWQEPQARSVSLRLAPHSLVAAQRAQQVSFAQPSLPLPWPLFLLWQPPPLALLPRPRPESFCALFPRRPRGSSSSASSFP
jgi:hypothetical protein